MSLPVPLEELAAALERRSNLAYLLTVGDDGITHCVATSLAWDDEEIVAAAGRSSVRNATSRRQAVILSPPPRGLAAHHPGEGSSEGARSSEGGGAQVEDGYSLIVDVTVTGTRGEDGTGGGAVTLRPTHAVLHRPASPGTGKAHDCGHDCVHVYDHS